MVQGHGGQLGRPRASLRRTTENNLGSRTSWRLASPATCGGGRLNRAISKACTATCLSLSATVNASVLLPEQLDPVSLSSISRSRPLASRARGHQVLIEDRHDPGLAQHPGTLPRRLPVLRPRFVPTFAVKQVKRASPRQGDSRDRHPAMTGNRNGVARDGPPWVRNRCWERAPW
jgi:hypothetical protein